MIYKIECCDNTAATIVENMIDEHCVIEGAAILTEHKFTDLEQELVAPFVATTKEPNDFDQLIWTIHYE